MTPPYRIELFGGVRVLKGGRVIARLQPPRTGTLLACLALAPDAGRPREELMELLWPEVEPETGRNRLRQALHVLREALQAEDPEAGRIVVSDRNCIRLDSQLANVDLAEFNAAVRASVVAGGVDRRRSALETCIELHCGELLPGYYDDWLVSGRERVASLYSDSLLALAAILEEAGETDIALRHARSAAAADPLREEAHIAIMRMLDAAGRATEAIRQYRELERVLDEELGERPGRLAQEMARAIRERQDSAQAEPASSPVVRSGKLEPEPLASRAHIQNLEPIGGVVPLASRFYVPRDTDREFEDALSRRDSIVLIKGPRQIGKTSLLARGLQKTRQSGQRVFLSDLQKLTAAQMATADSFLYALAELLVEQLELKAEVARVWDPERSWNINFERFLRRHVLAVSEVHLVWGLDEVDRLFSLDYGTEVFGLFRSWYNERSLDPSGPWGRLTLAMAYATEAHLFITDLNQSPFNVGTRVTLRDFTVEQVRDLNQRYGGPLRTVAEVDRLFALVGGNPYLVRRALHEMVTQKADLGSLEAAAKRDSGPFADHLQRMALVLRRDAGLCAAVRAVLSGKPCPNREAFHRLASAGVMSGETIESASLRCRLYADYLNRAIAE